MKYLAAYLLLVQGGNTAPSASDISSLLSSVGVDSEESRITSLLSELEGKSVEELVAQGSSKLASVPTGGAAGASSGSAASAGAAAGEAAEEKEEEAKEESDDDMGFGLFD